MAQLRHFTQDTQEAMNMISLTERAANRVRAILANEGKGEDFGLRVYIKGGGCAGFQYCFDLDNQPKENDQIINCHGVKVFLDAKSALHLVGTEIDYKESLLSSGFEVQNPNAKSTCGCGISFS